MAALSAEQVRHRIALAVASSGGIRPLARKWRVSPAHIHDLVNGRRGPGPGIAKRIGVRVTRITEVRYDAID